LSKDIDAATRFQTHLTCLITGRLRPSSTEFLLGDAENPWMRRSIVLGGTAGVAGTTLKQLMSDGKGPRRSEGELALIEELSEAVAASGGQRMAAELGSAALTDGADPAVGLAALRGSAKVWARKGVPTELRSSLVPAEKLADLAHHSQLSTNQRITAVTLLAYAPEAAKTLRPFLARDMEQPIRIAAVASLARVPGATHWDMLLKGFASDTPPVRRAIIDGMLANTDRTKMLLDAIEAGQIKTSEIDAAQVKRLVESRDAGIKERAGKVLAAAMPADRAKALAEYQPVLSMKGDSKNGQVVFEKNCAACHRIAGIGVNVAPDISDSRTKKPEQLLADILQPNRAIDNNYVGYAVRQLDGTVLTDILAAETATSITLRQQGGKEAVIPHSEIDVLRSTGQSLMPEGLERNIPPQDMADLISFIKNWRYLDGRTPLSEGSGQ